MNESTSDLVLKKLEENNLKSEGSGLYRSNRPWSNSSDSMGLVLRINGPEYGVFYDHVDCKGGSLYDLALRLDIPVNDRNQSIGTKRSYRDLEEYARAHGVDPQVFRDAGWEEGSYPYESNDYERLALKFITKNGIRWRFIDGDKPTFKSPRGYKSCWYGLDRAVELGLKNQQPIIICNGEPSVVVAQHYGVASCAVTSGEKKIIPGNLLEELRKSWEGEIIIAPDCDDTGKAMAEGISSQLEREGYSVRSVDLNGGTGFDLADLCNLHKEESWETLVNLPELEFEIPKNQNQARAIWAESEFTDAYNAIRLANNFGDRLKWVQEWGWYVYNGSQWVKDRSGKSMRFAKDTARSIYNEAAEAVDDKRAKQLGEHARSSLSRSRLEAMLSLAESELSDRPEKFDTHHMLLNVKNGLLDLSTGELSPHNPNWMITKIAGTYFDPDAKALLWENFINHILNEDRELVEFVQRSIGYSLTGSVSEQVLLFLYGNGANGKSTLLNTILALLGDYASQAAPKLLMKGNRHSTEIADLQGKRFVSTVEVEEGRQMAEVLVKQITGGDRIKARYMYRDFFEFEPTFKIWLAANYKPVIRGTDHAIWRRIRLIPFEITIPEEEQDKNLTEKLILELPGILNWAIEGCRKWQETGLTTPDIVKRATAAYRSEMDILAQFIDEICYQGGECEASAKMLYEEFSSWGGQTGEKPWSRRMLGLRLGERGFTKKRGMYGVIWKGIGIKNHSESEENP